MGVASGAALLAAALIAPTAAQADTATTTVKDQYGAQASSQVLDLDLLGRHLAIGSADVNSNLDSVAKNVTAEAKSLGVTLVPGSQAIAHFNDPNSVNKACALPQVQQVTSLLSGVGQGLNLPLLGQGLSLGGLLPQLGLDVGCAEANVAGTPDSFMAESVGGTLQIHVGLPQIVSQLASTLQQTVAGLPVVGNGNAVSGLPIVGPIVGNLPIVGGLLGASNSTQNVTNTLGGLNNLLGNILGSTANVPVVGGLTSALNLNTISSVLSPGTTVSGLLSNLQGDLITIDLGVSTARNAGDLQSYLSEAVSQGGTITVLPNLLGANKPLLKIDIAKSDAKVSFDRNTMQPTGTATNTLVRVTSALLPDLGLGSLPIVGGLLSNTGIPVLGSVVPMINGLLGGVPVAGKTLGGLLPFNASVKGLGLNSGTDANGNAYVELAPGMSVSLLCSGIVAPLCTEISVGAAQAPTTTADGRMHVESSTVTINLLKGLGDLTSSLPIVGSLPIVNQLNLGTILGNGLLGNVLNPIVGAAGLNIGEPTNVPGIQISLAHAMAEAGGTKVMGASVERPKTLAPVATPAPVAAPAALPRTGGLPFDATDIPLLAGAAVGLRAIVRRRRRNG
jgi:hypothetical protein